jgi:hypothetical protein
MVCRVGLVTVYVSIGLRKPSGQCPARIIAAVIKLEIQPGHINHPSAGAITQETGLASVAL